MKRAILNEQFLNGYIINENASIGTIQIFGGEHIPNGYLECNGQALSKTNYPRLYSVIGDTYGSTETTFNIPDLRDKFVQGARENVGTEKAAGLPNLIGQVGVSGRKPYSDGELFTTIPGQKEMSGNSYVTSNSRFEFNANKYNSIYGNSDTVQPPSICMYYIIKATDYTQATEDILDDTKITTGNVLSAAKVVEMNSYSTDEIKTEYRWVDNKPVYRKVFIDPNNSWSSEDNLIGNIENFKEPISIKAIALNSSLMAWVENNERGNSRCYAYIKSNGEVHFYRNDIRDGVAYPKKVIIKYTKTTD